jgi:hypothetical protein
VLADRMRGGRHGPLRSARGGHLSESGELHDRRRLCEITYPGIQPITARFP